MLYLACYDIERNRTRQRVATRLLTMGLERVQLSVFVGPLTPPQLEQLMEWMQKQLDPKTNDKFLVVPLDQYAIDNAEHCGENPPDWDYLSGNALCLII